MKKVFLDTNVILDSVLIRDNYLGCPVRCSEK